MFSNTAKIECKCSFGYLSGEFNIYSKAVNFIFGSAEREVDWLFDPRC
jgi:hypothetical protein